MQEQTALDLFNLQQSRDSWEKNVAGYCKDNNMQVGNLPKEVSGPYDEMNEAWEKLKSEGESASNATAQQFHKATAKLEKAWDNMVGK
ncbi:MULTISPECIES: hypothetical protein [Thalassospira]|uniref:hypothetical protein n=1 Tax=Thalassospira TaxID=168934 RepID=UPI0008DD435A|nr:MULTISPECIES: hypothetical protein [Thalassospira]MAB33679.1 hypothetical protein [Thalassospira sp.]MBA04816.1 hypothetical protein [Thalassospira sp.]MDM7977223.1 hypothetical protein [Thalassospira xiamenensis]OHY99167.1 hypothetical protein BC440_01395 [Thalassospira sp. MIT1004]OSQ32143.1 hypothetical protein TH468_00310 [Thalassospira sp. MCCC 1A03138]|tara:strand:+ start:115 stop:378 length:264 start_codon:yes stop_codon:yes gene_type:complete